MLGAGATGGYFGMRLAQAGADVTFLVRPARAEVLSERGLRLLGPGGEERIEPQLVTAEAIDGPYDLVLVMVKATTLDSALEDLAAAVGPESTVIPFLNGIAHLDTVIDRYGSEATVLGGVVRISTHITAEGDIEQFGSSSAMIVGALDLADLPRLGTAAAALGGADFDFSVGEDIVGGMWAKWVYIATLAAAGALTRGSVGDVVAQPGGAEFGRQILAECAAIAAACGHRLAPHDYEAAEAMITNEGSTFTASLLRDLQSGEATETEQILGDLTQRARWTGTSTPLLDVATLSGRVHEHRRQAQL